MKTALLNIWTSRWVRLIAGLLVSGVTLYLALRNVDLRQVWQALTQANGWLASMALLSVAVNIWGKGVRWKILMGRPGQPVSLGKVLMALLAGHMLNTVFPARVGDLSRVYVVGSLGPGRTFVLGTIVVEKLLDSLAYALLFVLLLLLTPLPGWINDSGYIFAALTLLITLFTLVLAFRRAWLLVWIERLGRLLPERLQSYTFIHLKSGLASLDVLQSPVEVLQLALWTTVVWGTSILTNHLTLLAFGLQLPLTASILILIGLQAGISLPSIPGKIGIFEYICILALSVFGIDQAIGLSYGIALHVIVFAPTTLLGLIFFWMLDLDRKDARVFQVNKGN